MLLRSGIIVAAITLLSRLFGFAREFFIALTFGTSQIADCVNVALKFPNLFRRIFGEGAMSAAFVPMFTHRLAVNNDEARQFSGKIFSLLLLSLIVITVISELIMPYLLLILAPGFYLQEEKFSLAVVLCRITTPYLIFISVVALFGGILNTVKRFAAFAFSPVIMNISVIAFTYLLEEEYTAHYSVAYSLLISGVLQALFMYYYLRKANLAFPLILSLRDKEVTTMVKNMGPVALSSSAQQFNLFISQSIASFLPGAVSILSYADRLYQLPLALIGITFGTILLPELSLVYKQQDIKKANFILNQSIKSGFLISIPAFIGLFALSEPIIHLIYEHGQFTSSDTIKTAQALAAFSIGLPAFILAKIITPVFYANFDTKTPLKITVYSLVINTVLNIILMIYLEHVGIALGASIAGWINAYLLVKYARKFGDFKMTNDSWIVILKVMIGSFIMMLYIEYMKHIFGSYYFTGHLLIKWCYLLGTIAGSIVIFLIVSYLLKIHLAFKTGLNKF